MSNLRYAHDKHDDKTVVFQAAVLAILFHTFLLVVFYIPTDDYSQRVLSNKRIRMFNSAKSGPMSNDLRSILYYGDPTVISKPLHSYSVNVKENLNYVDDVVLGKQTTTYKPQIREFTKLDRNQVDISQSSKLLGSYATIYPFTIKHDKVQYPLATSADGTPLKGFSLGDAAKISEQSTPSASSKYKISFIGKNVMPRVVVTKKSGSLEHDKLGAKALLRYFGNENSSLSTKSVTIKWGATK